jgi:hypothetical protein
VVTLRKVECVKIKRIAGLNPQTYVIESFESTSANRIPTNKDRSRECSVQLTARMEREYAEFGGLRSEVCNTVRNAHLRTSCEFCQSVMHEVVMGDCMPTGRLLVFLGKHEGVMDTLATFVNALLILVKRSGDARGCSGQAQVPQLLYNFLFDTVN